MRAEGFANAETLERLLVDEKLQGETRGQVLWVDEAGMLSTRSMQRLFEVARQQECRIILSGDYRQHASVEAGDSMRLLESEAGVRCAKLTKIQRQKSPAYRKAVEEISRGTAVGARKGFDRLDKMGAVVEAVADDRHRMLVADYLEAVGDGKSALIIAPTHAEGDRLTGELRSSLRERGVLGEEREFVMRKPTNWTDAQKQDGRNYETGMVVEFHQSTSGIRQRANGKRETVGGFERGARAVVIKGGESVWLLASLRGPEGRLCGGLRVLEFNDAAVRLVGEFAECQQVGGIVAVRGMPFAFGVTIASFEGDAVEHAVLGRAFPDRGRHEADSNLVYGRLGARDVQGLLLFVGSHVVSPFHFGRPHRAASPWHRVCWRKGSGS